MRRRSLILAGGCVACLGGAAHAQAPAKVQRIGWLDYSSAAENLGIFVQAMTARGWAEGRTFAMYYRGGEGNAERLSQVAAALVKIPVDVIVAPGTAETLAATRATATIPIVMSGVDDPVGRKLIASFARPSGNVTGLASTARELNEKLLSLVRDLLPKATSVAVLYDANDVDGASLLKQIQASAKSVGLSAIPAAAQRPADVEPAIAAARKQGAQVLFVLPSSMLIPNWIADLALRNRLPMVSTASGYAFDGGLLAYTDDRIAVFERVAFFVDRILKGAKPAEMPVELPSKFRLILNDKTGQSLRLAIPKTIELVAEKIQ